ncbi:RUS family member 1-like isoform X2 [Dysidea avara]|uniref:RUS family member 1-like isoform X2 n=1 Tax=Dysidea avara TaxID=196820 RepID=UPI003320AF28
MTTDSLRIVEYYSKGAVRSYEVKNDRLSIVPVPRNTGFSTSVTQFFKEVFLPEGYPDSVSDDYWNYQKWDTLQAFCSSITGTLATHAVLKGVGVGDSSATAAAATITWLLKDGAGMVGRILFAWLQGSDLDCNAKKWRFVADILNDTAIFLELLSPLFPTLFLPIVCTASVTKAIVGVAGGATRAALTQHQARCNNMADVSAKDGSQETLVNLSALLVGLVLTPLVTGSQQLIWLLFILFTFLHLLFNYHAVASVKMETLNRRRLHLLIQHYLTTGVMLSPAIVNHQEPILAGFKCYLSYQLGCELRHVIREPRDVVKHEDSLVIISLTSKQQRVHIALHKDSTSHDQLRGCVQVELLQFIFNHWNSYRWETTDFHQLFDNYYIKLSNIIKQEPTITGGVSSSVEVELIQITEEIVSQHFGSLKIELEQAGWITERNLLGPTGWRYNLNHDKFV